MVNCPIWGTEAWVSPQGHIADVVSNRAGGSYRLTGTAEAMLVNLDDEQKAMLTSWLVDQRLSGEASPTIGSDTLKQALARRPLRYSDKKRRVFVWLSQQRWKPDDLLHVWGVVTPETIKTIQLLSALIESSSDNETAGFVRLLMEEGLFDERGSGRLRLTPKGFEMLESVETLGAASDQAFVAMWFDTQMEQAFEDGILPAVEDSGFTAFRVDRKETINKIDDEIVAEIRRSRFVIADFTCGAFSADGATRSEARGGVYFEAGLAQGLGIPVIWTVRQDCIDHVHFDTRQFAHIVWSDPNDLRTRLTNRIRAVIDGSRG